MNAAKVLEDLKRRFPNEPEYHQAVEEVLGTIEEEYNKHPEFDKVNLIERLCIPDRVYQFRVTWMTTKVTSRPTWVTVYNTTTLSARTKAVSVSTLP